MNPVLDLAREMQTPSAHFEASNALAKRILGEMGAESVPFNSFNDDDWYTYNAETLELQAGRGAHYERPAQPAAPLKTVRGMTAKYLGLWQYKAEGASTTHTPAQGDARLQQLEKNEKRYQKLKELFFGCDFNYGDDQLNVLIFDLPKGVSVSANLDSTVDGIINKAEGTEALNDI